jgi:hypothetical protein
MSGPCRVHLVCGGKYHDFDYARLELLRCGLRWARGAEPRPVRTGPAPG